MAGQDVLTRRALAAAVVALAPFVAGRAAADNVDDDDLTPPKRLTVGVADDLLGQLGPDGKTLYFVSNRDTTTQVFAQSMVDGRSHQLFDDGADVTWPRVVTRTADRFSTSRSARGRRGSSASGRLPEGDGRICLQDPVGGAAGRVDRRQPDRAREPPVDRGRPAPARRRRRIDAHGANDGRPKPHEPRGLAGRALAGLRAGRADGAGGGPGVRGARGAGPRGHSARVGGDGGAHEGRPAAPGADGGSRWLGQGREARSTSSSSSPTRTTTAPSTRAITGSSSGSRSRSTAGRRSRAFRSSSPRRRGTASTRPPSPTASSPRARRMRASTSTRCPSTARCRRPGRCRCLVNAIDDADTRVEEQLLTSRSPSYARDDPQGPRRRAMPRARDGAPSSARSSAPPTTTRSRSTRSATSRRRGSPCRCG